MKSLLFLLTSFLYCWGTLVLELPNPEEKTLLTLDQDIEINQPITLCIRFNLKNLMTSRYIFSSQNAEIAMRIRFSKNDGYVTLHGEDFVFEIPKDHFHPYTWYHLCFRSGFLKSKSLFQ